MRWIIPVAMFSTSSASTCSWMDLSDVAEDMHPDSDCDGVDELDAAEVGDGDLGRQALCLNLPLRVASGMDSPSLIARMTCSYFRRGPARSLRA